MAFLSRSRISVKTVMRRPGFPFPEVALLFSIQFLVQVPLALSAELSLPGQSATPGTSIVLPAVIVSQANSISGVQFDLQYDSSAMALVATLGDAARNSSKSLYYADLGPNERRFLIVGQNQNVIPDGTLMNLFVNLNPNAANAVYPLAFSNVAGTDPNGCPIPVSGTDGTLTVSGTSGQSVALQLAGVLNGGSLLAGPVAPGEIVTLIGSRIGPASMVTPVTSSTSMATSTSVQFDGIPARVLYASPNLINLVIPYEVSGRTTTQLQVTNGGRVIASLPLPVAPSSPAIFTLDASGVGPGAVLNEDSTINSPSNPAARGSLAVLFATGAGQKTDRLGEDGQTVGSVLPKPVLPVSVQVGGLDAEVLGADTGRELPAGVLQVKFRIPANVAPGYSAPVVLTIGTASSQRSVNLAVR
jgi:uncharacterized protein (TIGR03437 family)